METKDLWGDILDKSKTAEDVIPFIKEQASLLGEKTKQKVLAKFEKIKYTYKSNNSGLTTMLTSISASLSAMHGLSDEKVEIDDNENLENASQLFKTADYKFEIYNEHYKFRLFTLKFRSTYPIELDVEYGILEEKSTKLTIKTKEELERKLIDIFNSAKVRFVISKMVEVKK